MHRYDVLHDLREMQDAIGWVNHADLSVLQKLGDTADVHRYIDTEATPAILHHLYLGLLCVKGNCELAYEQRIETCQRLLDTDGPFRLREFMLLASQGRLFHVHLLISGNAKYGKSFPHYRADSVGMRALKTHLIALGYNVTY